MEPIKPKGPIKPVTGRKIDVQPEGPPGVREAKKTSLPPAGEPAVSPLSTMDKLSDNLEKISQDMGKFYKFVSEMASEEVPTFYVWCKENGPELIKKSLSNLEQGKDWREFIGTTNDSVGEAVKNIYGYVGLPSELIFSKILQAPEIYDVGALPAQGLTFGFKVFDRSARLADIISRSILTKQVKYQLKLLEGIQEEPEKLAKLPLDVQTTTLPDLINKLKQQIAQEEESLAAAKESLFLGTMAYLPGPVRVVSSILLNKLHVPDPMKLHIHSIATGAGVGTAGVFLTISLVGVAVLTVFGIALAYHLVDKAKKDIDVLKDYAQLLKGGGLKKKGEEGARTIRLDEFGGDKKVVIEGLETARMKENLQVLVEKREKIKEPTAEERAERQQLMGRARELRTQMFQKKLQIQTEYNKFQHTERVIALVLSIKLVSLLAIKVCVFLGVLSLATAGLVVPWILFGFLVGGIALMVVGMIVYYSKRPNLWKTFWQGIELRFRKLGKSLHTTFDFEYKKIEKELEKIDFDTMLLSANMERLKATQLGDKVQLSSVEQQKLGKRLVLEQTSLKLAKRRAEDKLEVLEEKRSELQERITAIEEQRAKARLTDFYWRAGLEEGSEVSLRETTELVLADILENLKTITEEDLKKSDAPTSLIFRRLGIDITSLTASDEDQDKVKQAWESFFSKDEVALQNFIKQHLSDLRFGLA